VQKARARKNLGITDFSEFKSNYRVCEDLAAFK
jgi:hypothetical protein